jgi:hypothetical protein
MWQLVVLFASYLINPQLDKTNLASNQYNQLEQSIEISADFDMLEDPSSSNQIVEEVLEEEIELSETNYLFEYNQLIDFQSYYLFNDYHSVLTSDYIPPETTV